MLSRALSSDTGNPRARPEERVEQHGAQLAPQGQALGRAEPGAFNKERVFSERKGRERTEKFS